MENEIFKYPDTNSARAKIDFLNRKFKNQKIAIIGMGGTGAYILDLVSKTPVKEIHIYDGDFFELHNAFRAPGAVDCETLNVEGLKKVTYYSEIYSKMRNNLFAHDEFISEFNLQQLAIFDYVFISVDKNKVRNLIISGLLDMKIPFIDVGLGVNRVKDDLSGTLRVTAGNKMKNDHLEDRIGKDDLDENDYSTNIQIADLNSLNASLAVIKWKKMCGFYQDLKQEHNSFYLISTNKIINEDYTS